MCGKNAGEIGLCRKEDDDEICEPRQVRLTGIATTLTYTVSDDAARTDHSLYGSDLISGDSISARSAR